MLPPDGTRADLPGLLYEGTTDNGSWNDFLRGVANALGGESAAFMFGRTRLRSTSRVSQLGSEIPEGIRLYAEHYGKLDVSGRRKASVSPQLSGSAHLRHSAVLKNWLARNFLTISCCVSKPYTVFLVQDNLSVVHLQT